MVTTAPMVEFTIFTAAVQNSPGGFRRARWEGLRGDIITSHGLKRVIQCC